MRATEAGRGPDIRVSLQKPDDRKHEHRHDENQPLHIVVFQPPGEVQYYDGDGD
jgi:hypothetical protein